jgi:hypothetical protein
MAYAGERPDLDALRELEEVLHHLADELAAWRRRALTAEAKVAEQPRLQGVGDGMTLRLRELQEENEDLTRRLDAARAQLAEIVGRLGFLEEQSLEAAGRGVSAR